ncbi:MAG: hypothetical protein ACFFDF_23905, partial [Candidatus Odinarchaeota archaeon]
PVHWYSFLAGFNLPYWIIYILGFLTFSFIGIILVEIIIIALLHYWYHRRTLNWLRFLDIIIYTAFLSHLFFPRGVYKYYFTFLVPIFILWFVFHYKEAYLKENSIRMRWLLYFIGMSLMILLIPRNFYLLLVWIIIIIIIFKSKNYNHSLQVKSSIIE